MTTMQIIAVLMTPAAGLAIAGVLAYVVRRDTAHVHRHGHHPAE